SRVTNDLFDIAELAHHGPEDLFTASMLLIGSFIIMARTNLRLSLIVFAFVPVMLLFSIRQSRSMRGAFKSMRSKVGDINAQLEDSLSGIRVAKAFNNEWFEEKKFHLGNMAFQEVRVGTYKIMAEFHTGVKLLSHFTTLTTIVFGGLFVYRGELSIGELMGFLLYVSMFLQPVRRITSLMEAYQRGMAGFRRFIDIMETSPDIADKPGAFALSVTKGDIVFDKVTFRYNEKSNVLSDVSFAVQAGETVAFVGPSGGGKTTLCSLIPRFYEIESGAITIDGIDIRDVTQASLRSNIGIVQQDVFLFSDTIKGNIAYGKVGASDSEITKAAIDANIHDFIMTL
ncbi:MAG: ABC transporter ATP-binding protein, partial [bacterium]|nr:ABC transporter ATP-binding protein [bacterium]